MIAYGMIAALVLIGFLCVSDGIAAMVRNDANGRRNRRQPESQPQRR